MSAFGERLAKMDETWKTSREEKGAGLNEVFQDGVKSFQLQSLSLKESNSTGELMAMAEHFCLEGGEDEVGEVYMSFFNLEKQNSEGKIWGQIFLAQLLEKLGFESPESMEGLEESLAEVADASPKYSARVKTNKEGYKNFTILKVTEQEAEFEGERKETEETESSTSSGAGSENGIAKLVEFCEAWDIKPPKNDRDSVIEHLREYTWKEDELSQDEVELLTEVGIPYEAKPKPKPTPKATKKPTKKPKKKTRK